MNKLHDKQISPLCLKQMSSNLDEKQLQCIREVSNLTNFKKSFMFDAGKTFNANELNELVAEYSPKVFSMLKNIQNLDMDDKKNYGKTFKHFIFSDLDKGYGAKFLASAMIANGYLSIYDKSTGRLAVNNKTLKGESEDKFVLLTSMPVFKTTIGPQLKKQILSIYNNRPSNIYGKDVRFIILDSSFKEGIDLFDVKYVHMLEPQTSKANSKQVIGRATRTCGQKGLQFIPNRGWPLNVYIYDTELTDNAKDKYKVNTLHELFLTGLDLRLFKFAEQLDSLTVVSSVDYRLNKNVHNFQVEREEMSFNIFKDISATGGGKVKCNGQCGKAPTPSVPATVADMILAWMSMGRIISKRRRERLREYFCYNMKIDQLFCQRVNEVYENRNNFIRKYKVIIGYMVGIYHDEYKRQVIKSIQSNISIKPVQPFVLKQELIAANFLKYQWPKASLENLCIENKSKVFKFTPTQDFIRHYFTPSSPEKGMLLYHTVGTGKTCTAIATATTSFETEGYTVLWVTRASLKSDIWKNMFDQICNVVIKEKLESSQKSMPSKLSERKRLLSKAWKIQPMSYKQFTNLLTKKNRKLYDDIVKINGREDPLKRTLLVIDEAHKLYGGDDLQAAEKPDTKKLEEWIQNSYKVSGDDSVKLLLMTATPYTNNPMELIKLLNLCREKQLSDNFENFSSSYLNVDGTFTNAGKLRYLNEAAGYVSYLNRELDARQFAQPNIHNVFVPMTKRKIDVENKKELNDKYKQLQKNLNDEIEKIKEEKRIVTKEASQISKEIKALSKCTGIKDKEAKEKCKKDVSDQKYNLQKARNDILGKKEVLDDNIVEIEKDKVTLREEKKKEIELFDSDYSQERILSKKCKL